MLFDGASSTNGSTIVFVVVVVFIVDGGTVTTPLWAKCEDETHTPESGNLESSGTLKNSEMDCRGQNTSH
jgi:hypothetical protein